MQQATYFMGLGGTGAMTLLYLKKRLLDYFGADEVGKYFQFLYLDTDQNELGRMRSRFEIEIKSYGNKFFNEDDEYLWLGGFVPRDQVAGYERYRVTPEKMPDEGKNVQTWIDDRAALFFSDQVLNMGADANRQLGRFCLMYHRNAVETRVNSGITSLVNITPDGTNQPEVRFVLIGSCCGGTGSSMFYDLLFMCNRIYRSKSKGAPRVNAVIYAPFDFIDRINDQGFGESFKQRYRINAWAFFEEIEHAFWDLIYSGKPNTERGRSILQNAFNPFDTSVRNYLETQSRRNRL
ncbi:MAG: hypothetical protein KIT57_10445 [Blastocatellales bacterium]|nr:hypothetical protein [Blastocatellales bacterium]